MGRVLRLRAIETEVAEKLDPPFAEDVVADVTFARLTGVKTGDLHRPPSSGSLVDPRLSRDLLELPPVAVPRAEVHCGVNACGILAEHRFDDRKCLHDPAPILGRKSTKRQNVSANLDWNLVAACLDEQRLQEGKSEEGGEGPELSQAERVDLLVTLQEGGDLLRLDPTATPPYQRGRDRLDPQGTSTRGDGHSREYLEEAAGEGSFEGF
jgi:hypothetical protein